MIAFWGVTVRIRGTRGDIDPVNKVLLREPEGRVQKGPLYEVSLILPMQEMWVPVLGCAGIAASFAKDPNAFCTIG